MNSKKAMLLPTTLKVVLAVAGIIIILVFFVKIFTTISESNEIKAAQNKIDVLKARINALKDGQANNFTIEGIPSKKNQWYITGWSKTDRGRPDKCFLTSCICILPSEKNITEETEDELKNLCQQSGFILEIETEELIIQNYDIQKTRLIPSKTGHAAPSQITTIPSKTAIHLNKNLLIIEISKTKEKITLTHYTDEYLQQKS
jgi:hypothetical protein